MKEYLIVTNQDNGKHSLNRTTYQYVGKKASIKASES